jgi:hypothetical protein
MTREEEIAEEVYQQRKRFAIMENLTLFDMAAKAWWGDYGMMPVSYFAKAYRVNLHKLTILIQKQMSEKVGIHLPNTAPKIEIVHSEQELKYHPSAFAVEPPYSLELYYYLKHGFKETEVAG